MVGTEQGNIEYKQFLSSWSLLQLLCKQVFCLIFSFFNDRFLLFILVSVAPNYKTVTESDLLNNIAGVLKYNHEKIGDGVVEK